MFVLNFSVRIDRIANEGRIDSGGGVVDYAFIRNRIFSILTFIERRVRGNIVNCVYIQATICQDAYFKRFISIVIRMVGRG